MPNGLYIAYEYVCTIIMELNCYNKECLECKTEKHKKFAYLTIEQLQRDPKVINKRKKLVKSQQDTRRIKQNFWN